MNVARKNTEITSSFLQLKIEQKTLAYLSLYSCRREVIIKVLEHHYLSAQSW